MASIKLNYPDMFQQIKLSIFTGDHSAIYSMACAVACIAASFSLITWYNKMLNDPYGRLDMRAVVRTLIVLFLTCNFYSFVLVPFDSITHTVTKAISASVDKDPSGLWGKVNDVYSSIEDKTKEETLVGQFDAEMENNKSNTTVDALSYETSAVAESLAEATIQEGKKPGFFKRLWAGVKGFVSGKVGMVMNNVGNIISALISVIVKLVQYQHLPHHPGAYRPVRLCPVADAGLPEQHQRMDCPLHPDFLLVPDGGAHRLRELQAQGCHAYGLLECTEPLAAGIPAAPYRDGPGDADLPACRAADGLLDYLRKRCLRRKPRHCHHRAEGRDASWKIQIKRIDYE